MTIIKRIAHRLHDIVLGVVLILAALCYGMNGAEMWPVEALDVVVEDETT